MQYELITLREFADDLKVIVKHLRGLSEHERYRVHKLYSELDDAEKCIQEFPFSFQEISPGVHRIPLNASRLYVYYRVLVREVTVVAIIPQPNGPDVATSYHTWPESVRNSLKHLTWLPPL